MAKLTLQQAFELAVTEHQRGNLPLAHSLYSQILRINPAHAEALHGLGVVCGQMGNPAMAVDVITRALTLKPRFPAAYCNLGNVLHDLGRMDDAIRALREGINQNSGQANAFNTLGNVYRDIGLLDDALDNYRNALSIQPQYLQAHSNILFTMMFHPSQSAEAIAVEGAKWNDQHAKQIGGTIKPHSNERSTERRLRIGYVGSDFRSHCQSLFTIPLFQHHDRFGFEIFCYSTLDRPDAVTDSIRAVADQWREVNALTDEQVSQLIRTDQIDVLVDLSMHMNKNRLLAFARKPAPVQVTWLAYPGTTGMTAIDYRLTDRFLDPPVTTGHWYSEETVRLPDTFWCYDPMEADLPVNELPAIKNDHLTFGCLNNYCKVNEPLLKMWGQVLAAVPTARFLLLCPAGAHRANVVRALGIDESRIEFVGRRHRRDYLQLYHRVDLCLDTFPYNGHTTSLDALWMGVPVVTLCGERVVSRAGYSQMVNLGLEELVTRTPAEFVEFAISLGGDLVKLSRLRKTLRRRMEASPLMDAARFARNMEMAYRAMWRRWCESTAP